MFHRFESLNPFLMRTAAVAFALALSVALPGASPRAEPALSQARVKLGETVFLADIADTPSTQSRGLGGRARLEPHDAMLFLYKQKTIHTFWMKGMLIPIDILWLDNRRIVYIAHRVPPPAPGTPDSQLPTYASAVPANAVLEIAAGRAAQLGLRVGDSARFDFSTQ